MSNVRIQIVRVVRQELTAWSGAVIASIPGRVGMRLRRSYFRILGAKIGHGLIAERGVHLAGGDGIRLGDNVRLSIGCQLYAEEGLFVLGDRSEIGIEAIIDASIGEIVIGRDVMVAARVSMRSTSHRFTDPTRPISEQGHERGKIVVGDDVWIGTNATVLPNTTIGAHAIVGAGAVVTRDVPEAAIVAGVPARVISRRVGFPTLDKVSGCAE